MPRATKAQVVDASAHKFGVPPWILWGVFGAESTYGTNGDNWFGLVDVPARNKTNLQEDSEISAKTLAHWKAQLGTWPAAIEGYSGKNYGIQHVLEMSQQGKAQARERVPTSAGFSPSGKIDVSLGEGIPLLESLNPENWLKKNPAETPPGKELPKAEGVISSLEGVAQFFADLTKLIFTPAGLMQIAEMGGGIIMIFWGLHRLFEAGTGVNIVGSGVSTAKKAVGTAATVATVVK